MWTAPQLQPPIPGPPNAIPPTTKPPLRRRSVAVYNFQNREQMFQAAVIAAGEPQNQSANTKPPAKQELEERRDLSGADILMALGKAAAQKTEKKKKKKETKKVSTNQGIRDFSRVSPLCIKPEWSDRLQELEERLEELAHM